MMKRVIRVASFDIGFAECGFCEIEVDKNTGDVEPIRMGVIVTKPSTKKRKVLAIDDNLRRARELSALIGMLVSDADLVCTEAMSLPRNASSSAKIGIAWGVLISHAQACSVPVLQVTPAEVRHRMLGHNRKATKDDVEHVLVQRFGKKLFSVLLKDITPSRHNHAYDALAAAIACLDSEQVRLMMVG